MVSSADIDLNVETQVSSKLDLVPSISLSDLFSADFPKWDRENVRSLKENIDATFREFLLGWGETIDTSLDPFHHSLVWYQKIFLTLPWAIVLAFIFLTSILIARRFLLAFVSPIILLLAGFLGSWPDIMKTLSISLLMSVVCIFVGLVLGWIIGRSKITSSLARVLLDFLQVGKMLYMIVFVMLVGIGIVPGFFSILLFAMVPTVRMTIAGILHLKGKEHISSLSPLPFIREGISQTILFVFIMSPTVAMIGTAGLGVTVLRGAQGQFFALLLVSTIAMVTLAIWLDRVVGGLVDMYERRQGV